MSTDDEVVLIRRLVDRLEADDITYCHWKSNDMLAASASGENDLDLLVSRADATRCRALLHELGFVEALQRPSRRVPGVLDYHGYDAGLRRPVHVHLHSRLVLGDDMTKNVRLPIEEEYLASVRRQGMFRVPAPEFELCVFVIRMVLKHCSWDAMLMLQGGLGPSERRELDWLTARSSLADTHAVVDRLLPEIGVERFERCRRAISEPSGMLTRAAIGRDLQRALTTFSRRRAVVDASLKATRRVYWLGRRYVRPRSRRKSLAHGGLVVSIGGADLAVRRRLVDQLDEWLAKDVAVLPIEYGSDPAGSSGRALRFAASGGIVLSADHPAGVRGKRSVGIPPPDLEILLDHGPQDDVPRRSGHRVVHLGPESADGDPLQAVQRALWDSL